MRLRLTDKYVQVLCDEPPNEPVIEVSLTLLRGVRLQDYEKVVSALLTDIEATSNPREFIRRFLADAK